MKSILETLHKKVRIETVDKEIFEGEVVSCESGILTDSGYDEISLDYPTHRLSLSQHEIKEILIIA